MTHEINPVARLIKVLTTKYDLISDWIWYKAWKNVDFSPQVISVSFLVNDLLSRRINRVKKSIVPALLTKLVTILATELKISENEIFEKNCSEAIFVSILYASA